MIYWDRAIYSIYGSLLDALKCDIGAPSSGSIVSNKSKGNEYFQHRISYAGSPLNIPIHLKGIAQREGWNERRKLVSTLIGFGVNAPDAVASKTFELLDAIGCFSSQKAILIGSHAFNAIGNNLGVTWDAGFETKDIDLGRMIKVSCPPSNRTSDILIKAGFRAVYSLNHKHEPTTYIHKNGMKIDFLTPMLGKPTSEPALLYGAGVYAEPMRFLEYLIKDPQHASIMTRNGILVEIPQSSRYALHKCIVYQYRRDDSKKHKDLLQAESILSVLEERSPHMIVNAWEDLTWKDKALIGISEFRDKELISNIHSTLGV